MPHFQGGGAGVGPTHAEATLAAKARANETREAHSASQLAAVEHMTKKYESERSGSSTLRT